MKEIPQPTMMRLPLSQIDSTDFENLRVDLKGDEWDNFVASIQSTGGPTQPVGVRRVGSDYSLIYGFRRFAACEEAELAEVNCCVFDTDEEGARVLNLVENLQRKDLHWCEVAYGYAALAKQGMSQKAIAKHCNVSGALVSLHLALANAGFFSLVLDRYREGEANLPRELANKVEKATRDKTAKEACEAYLATLLSEEGEEEEGEGGGKGGGEGGGKGAAIRKGPRYYVQAVEARAMLAQLKKEGGSTRVDTRDGNYLFGAWSALNWLLTKTGGPPAEVPEAATPKRGRKSAKAKAKEAES